MNPINNNGIKNGGNANNVSNSLPGNVTDARSNKGDGLLTVTPPVVPASELPTVPAAAPIITAEGMALMMQNPLFAAAVSAAVSAATAPTAAPVLLAGTVRVAPNFNPNASATLSTERNAQWVAVVIGFDDVNDGAYFAADKTAAYYRALSPIQGYRSGGAKFDGNGKSYVWRGIAQAGQETAHERFAAYMTVAQYQAWRDNPENVYLDGRFKGLTPGQVIDAAHELRKKCAVPDSAAFTAPRKLVAPTVPAAAPVAA